LKPPNIYFSRDDRKTAKIGDFGLVIGEMVDSLFANEDTLKSYHTGSSLYMSPEQVEKHNKRLISKKVDIYAMGIILFELLYPFGTKMERKSVREVSNYDAFAYLTNFVGS
jgi:serine/threonine protein kinase